MNYQSANEEFNKLVACLSDARLSFYEQLAERHSRSELVALMRENEFIDWQHPALQSTLN